MMESRLIDYVGLVLLIGFIIGLVIVTINYLLC